MGSNSYMTVALHLLDAVWANEDVKDEMLPMYDPDSPEEFFHGGKRCLSVRGTLWHLTHALIFLKKTPNQYVDTMYVGTM